MDLPIDIAAVRLFLRLLFGLILPSTGLGKLVHSQLSHLTTYGQLALLIAHSPISKRNL